MDNKKMMIIYIAATILCAIAGISKFTQGNTTNGLLWIVASFCWGTCIFNSYNNSKK